MYFPKKQLARFVTILFVVTMLFSLYPQTNTFATSLHQAPGSTLEKWSAKRDCVWLKIIPHFRNENVITRNGFYIDLYGTGSIDFTKDGFLKYATLSVAPDFSGEYMASRITEIDPSVPSDQWKKCWKPTSRWDVVVEFVVRFEKLENPGLTENLMLWNAPIHDDEVLPFTTMGVTRNMVFPGYLATVSQDFVFGPVPSGFIHFAPMPAWLDPTDWHYVRIRVAKQAVKIAVAQLSQGSMEMVAEGMALQEQGESVDFDVVVDVELPAPVEPLAFEFSVDNEVMPGMFVPVVEQDSLDVAFLFIHYARNR